MKPGRPLRMCKKSFILNRSEKGFIWFEGLQLHPIVHRRNWGLFWKRMPGTEVGSTTPLLTGIQT